MKILYFFCSILLAFSFNACQEKVGDEIVSSGTNNTKEQLEAMKNIDRNSYAEVSDVFKETSEITSDNLPFFLVFSANGCVYCDRLKNLIKENPEIKSFLKSNYAPYYINISYTKTHKIRFSNQELSTADLAQKYNIKPTPTLVFLSQSGKELFIYPGFMPKNRFFATLEFLTNPTLETKESQNIAQELQTYWKQKGV
ncbi:MULTISPECIES: SoxW family protein [Helicobacter]|uniref:SoxW family protein n=1 Tax=Helicobacter TaxID=209 RepID=UPI00261836A2|nr:thioredoxin family protein [Helicobacter sp. UBA3407]